MPAVWEGRRASALGAGARFCRRRPGAAPECQLVALPPAPPARGQGTARPLLSRGPSEDRALAHAHCPQLPPLSVQMYPEDEGGSDEGEGEEEPDYDEGTGETQVSRVQGLAGQRAVLVCVLPLHTAVAGRGAAGCSTAHAASGGMCFSGGFPSSLAAPRLSALRCCGTRPALCFPCCCRIQTRMRWMSS